MTLFPVEIVSHIVRFIPPVDDTPAGTSLPVLSNRRNKGLLTMRSRCLMRELNLEFFNSGVNDGLSSSLIRESVILRGRLAEALDLHVVVGPKRKDG